MTINELKGLNVNSFSVKDSSVRGFHTARASELKIGDLVLICNHWEEVTEEPATEPVEVEQINLDDLRAENDKAQQEARSCWSKAVHSYVDELIDNIDNYFYKNNKIINYNFVNDFYKLKSICLNGADNWSSYSWGGCSLVYNYDIARRCCTPSEFKKTREGMRAPNSRENWLDVQARALYQAFNKLCQMVKNYKKED